MNDRERNAALTAALSYLDAGISVLPIKADGSKAPAVGEWSSYSARMATKEEVESWYQRLAGVGIVGGAISGNLAIIDIEYADTFAAFCDLVEVQEPGLISCLPHVLTPGKGANPGHHLYARTPTLVGSQKLAHLSADEAKARTGDARKTTAIEIKGDRGYVLAPGSPALCHETGRIYTHVGGPFIEEAPVLTAEQWALLVECARSLSQEVPAVVETYHGAPSGPLPDGAEDRPGSIFNRRGDWQDILGPHGWVATKTRGAVTYWRRPGKAKGISATTGHCSSQVAGDLLCVFSSNAAPLDVPAGMSWKCFSKFAAHALLNHAGDFSAAARDLGSRGFGVDVALSQVESEAQFVAAQVDIKGLSSDEILDVIKRRLEEIVRKRSINVRQEDIDAAAIRARDHRIQDDPKRLSADVSREIEESASSSSPRWKLIIVENDPPTYLLKAPFWSAKPKTQATNGFIAIKDVRDLRSWFGIFDAAAIQAETSIPEKLNGWRRLLDKLFQQAGRISADLEMKRPLVIAEWLWTKLSGARKQTIDATGAPIWSKQGSPTLLTGGAVIVKVPWLLSVSQGDPEPIARGDMVRAMRAAGMRPAFYNNWRWWEISKTSLALLKTIARDGLADAALVSQERQPGEDDVDVDSSSGSVQSDPGANGDFAEDLFPGNK